MSALRVLRAGLATTAQDLGVRGRAHLGVSRGGAFDARSLALANAAVGNAPGDVGLEVLLQGPELEVRQACVAAWCGAPFDVEVDGAPWPPQTARPLLPGARLRVGRCAVGARCALAFAGGLVLPRGAALRAGDELALGAPPPPAPGGAPGVRPPLEVPAGVVRLRVTASTHTLLFAPEARAALVEGTFAVQPGSDRRGVRLRGPPLRAPDLPALLTEGVTVGVVQVTPSGEAIALGVEQATTGGYPKIAAVIQADTWLLAQLRPGAAVRFELVEPREARAILRAEGPCA